MTRYFFGPSHEEVPPEALLQQVVAAERAGFDGIGASDHLQPWWEPGESGHTWVWLGAAAPGTAATPIGAPARPPPARRRRPTARRPLPPGTDRPGVDDARAHVPRPPLPRNRLGRGAQRGP